MLRGACFYIDFIKRSICLGTIIAAVPQLRIQANRKLQIACRTLLGLAHLVFALCFQNYPLKLAKNLSGDD